MLLRSSYSYHHDDYYDDKHYLRVPPHVLSTPVLAEIPRLYGDQELEDFLLVSATYYFDEGMIRGCNDLNAICRD